MYNQKVMEIFANPKNVGMIKCADGVGEVEDKVCGDVVKLYIRIEEEVITELKFKAFGGVSTIACAYAVTEIAKEKTVEEALSITEQNIVEYLEQLPEERVYSATLAKEALLVAIDEYKKNLEKEMKKLESKK